MNATQTTTTTEKNMIAQTIQRQLGFALRMLGAHCLADHGDALSFKIKGSRKVNYIKITLDADDTYSVDFKKITRRGVNVKDVSDFSGVYVSSLKELITSQTGLYTTL